MRSPRRDATARERLRRGEIRSDPAPGDGVPRGRRGTQAAVERDLTGLLARMMGRNDSRSRVQSGHLSLNIIAPTWYSRRVCRAAAGRSNAGGLLTASLAADGSPPSPHHRPRSAPRATALRDFGSGSPSSIINKGHVGHALRCTPTGAKGCCVRPPSRRVRGGAAGASRARRRSCCGRLANHRCRAPAAAGEHRAR